MAERKIRGIDNFEYGKDEKCLEAVLGEDGKVSLTEYGFDYGKAGTAQYQHEVVLVALSTEATVKIMAALWEILHADGMNVAAKVQEYRAIINKRKALISSDGVVMVHPKSIPVKFKVSPEVVGLLPGLIVRKDENGEFPE